MADFSTTPAEGQFNQRDKLSAQRSRKPFEWKLKICVPDYSLYDRTVSPRIQILGYDERTDGKGRIYGGSMATTDLRPSRKVFYRPT
jgi:hypothetical protein